MIELTFWSNSRVISKHEQRLSSQFCPKESCSDSLGLLHTVGFCMSQPISVHLIKQCSLGYHWQSAIGLLIRADMDLRIITQSMDVVDSPVELYVTCDVQDYSVCIFQRSEIILASHPIRSPTTSIFKFCTRILFEIMLIGKIRMPSLSEQAKSK